MFGKRSENMKVLKGVLAEELENSLQMRKRYSEALQKLPRGSLVEKNIGGRSYYYIAFREKKKVRFVYKGRLSEAEVKRFKDAQKMRAKYRNLLREANQQIAFLKKVLRGKTV
jgi:hypothetical protein